MATTETEAVAFIRACLDCTSAEELYDFVQNNADKIVGEES